MDKRTRVLNAMNQKEVDHVPVGFWFHFSGEEAVGESCVQAHLKYYRETDLDFVKVMCDNYFPYPLPGAMKKPEDWRQLKPFGQKSSFHCRAGRKSQKDCRGNRKRKMCILQCVCSVLFYTIWSRGSRNVRPGDYGADSGR